MGRLRSVLAFSAAAGLAAPGFAAEPQQPTSAGDTIVVTGTAADREAERKKALDFVRKTGVARGQKPAARWDSPVCPKAIGIAPVYARLVEARVRAIAGTIGAELAKTPCRTNIAVTFATDAGAVVRKIVSRSPGRIAEVPMNLRYGLKSGDAPVRWWYSTETLDRNGMPAFDGAPPWSGGNAEGGGSVLPTTGSGSFTSAGSSLISTRQMRALRSATIVIDLTRAEGVPLDAVASYAAIVGLAEMAVLAPPPEDSILSLFERDDASRTPTDEDLALLRALYTLPLDREARQHRGLLTRSLVAEKMGEKKD